MPASCGGCVLFCLAMLGGIARRTTQAEFVERGIRKHLGKYTYPRSVYVGDATKLIITCPGWNVGDVKRLRAIGQIMTVLCWTYGV